MAVSPQTPLALRVERCARLCGARAWRLASALLRDREAAYDAVQQAFLVAAAKPERVPADDPWPWFSTVLVHEVRNLRRKRRPLTNLGSAVDGGAAMERVESERAAPDRAAESAEEAERLWAAVEALPAPEREALLLTHHAGLTHAEAAIALSVPRQTLTSRADRGLEVLAQRLGRDPARTATLLAAIPVLDPSGGIAGAMVSWTKAALAAQGTAIGLSAAAAAEGAFVVSKTTWILGVTVALGAGFLGGGVSEGFGLFGSREPSAPVPDAALLAATAPQQPGDGPRLQPATPDVAALRAQLGAETQRLTAQLAEAQREIAALKAASSTAKRSGSGAPIFTFGEGGRLEAVRSTDWAAIAEAGKVVQDAIVEMYELNKAGKPVPKEIKLRLQQNVERVRTYEYATIDKLPTAAQHNGELTHPISWANFVASALSAAGQPLTAEQIASIESLGTAFDGQFARLREGWSPAVPRVRRILEEYRLKGKFGTDLDAVLTQEQKTALIDPAYRGIAGLDLNDPTLMILHTSPVVTGGDVEQVRTKLGAMLRRTAGLAPEAASPAVDRLIDAFATRALRGVAPVAASEARHYSYAQGLQAGEAMADLVDGVLRDVDLAPPAREALLGDPTWYIPRLVKP